MFAIDLDIGDVVLEDSGDVDLRERLCQCMCMSGREIMCGVMGAQAG